MGVQKAQQMLSKDVRDHLLSVSLCRAIVTVAMVGRGDTYANLVLMDDGGFITNRKHNNRTQENLEGSNKREGGRNRVDLN